MAIVTPMKSGGRIDVGCMERLIDWHVEQGTAGIVVAGTTGESATMERSEHVDTLLMTAEYAGDRIPIIAGTGSNSTQQTIDLSLAVGESSIAAYLIVTPYYNKPTQEGLFQHFWSIADEVDKPVMLYNVPGRTAVDLMPATVARLAEHPRIFGIKEATGDVDRVGEIQALCGADFKLYSGDDATAREFMLRGGDGVVSVTSNVAPGLMVDMCKAAIGQDAEAAWTIDARLTDLHRDLFVESNPIPVKWALERMGMIPGALRLPLTRLIEADQPIVEAALAKAGLV